MCGASKRQGRQSEGEGDMGFLAAAMGNCKIQSQGLQVREISTKKLPKPEHPTHLGLGARFM